MPLDIGAALPTLNLKSRTGKYARPSKPTVLQFFKSTCPTCALTLPYLDRMDRVFSDAAVDVWGVSQEALSVADEFADRCGTSVGMLDDSALDASRSLEIENVPTTYLVDAEGQVQDVVIGLDKAGLNRLAGTLAEWAGESAPVVAPEDDGAPSWQPG